jgi:phosphate transport system substrate-binding protein
MIRSRARWGIALVLAFGVLAAACGSDTSSPSSGSGNGTSSTTKPAPPLAAATLAGSGATFPQAYYETVISEFKTAQPAVTVTYGGGGSGKGQSDLQAGLVQWAGSDSTVKPEDMAKYKGPFLYFPTVAAPITVSYNLSSVKNLQLSPETLAKIFEGQITKWNDPAIMAENSGATLPSTSITVAHRSDGSGTTANFTKYLVAAAGSAWTLGTDKVVAWPAGQQAGEGNAGVAQIVKTTNGAMG